MRDLFDNDNENDDENRIQEFYLVCPSCRVMSFNVVALVPQVGRTEHEIRCAGCDSVVTSGSASDSPDYTGNPEDDRFTWANDMPRIPPAGRMVDLMGYTDIVSTGYPSLAKRRVMKRVEEWAKGDTLALLVAYDSSGTGSTWMNYTTEEQRGWVLRRLDELRKMVENYNLTAEEGDPANLPPGEHSE